MPKDSQILKLTARVVTAHVGNNRVCPTDLGPLVARVQETLGSLLENEQGTVGASSRPSRAPDRDHISCLICGRQQRTLAKHLLLKHDITTKQYKRIFGLSEDDPLTAPSYSERRSAIAKAHNLGKRQI